MTEHTLTNHFNPVESHKILPFEKRD